MTSATIKFKIGGNLDIHKYRSPSGQLYYGYEVINSNPLYPTQVMLYNLQGDYIDGYDISEFRRLQLRDLGLEKFEAPLQVPILLRQKFPRETFLAYKHPQYGIIYSTNHNYVDAGTQYYDKFGNLIHEDYFIWKPNIPTKNNNFSVEFLNYTY